MFTPPHTQPDSKMAKMAAIHGAGTGIAWKSRPENRLASYTLYFHSAVQQLTSRLPICNIRRTVYWGSFWFCFDVNRLRTLSSSWLWPLIIWPQNCFTSFSCRMLCLHLNSLDLEWIKGKTDGWTGVTINATSREGNNDFVILKTVVDSIYFTSLMENNLIRY